MCDFSLQSVRSRPAKVGDKLVTRDFGTGTRGFADADDLGTAPDKADALLLARLGFGLRLRRQLQHTARLAFAQQSQQHSVPIGKLERIMMCGQLFFVNLTEDRRRTTKIGDGDDQELSETQS